MAATALLVPGLVLHLSGAIPFNKNLYSASYVMALGGMAGYCLSFCYVVIDILGPSTISGAFDSAAVRERYGLG
jgi:heparan-alpha-glucosaminide N-acetyltransferase